MLLKYIMYMTKEKLFLHIPESTDNGLFNLLFFLASVLIITKINLKTKEN